MTDVLGAPRYRRRIAYALIGAVCAIDIAKAWEGGLSRIILTLCEGRYRLGVWRFIVRSI